MRNLFGRVCQRLKKNKPTDILANYQCNPTWRKLNVPSIDYLPPDKFDDTHLYQRLIASYQKATSNKSDRGDGVWKDFSNIYHSKLATYLKHGDSEKVGLILSQMFRDPVTSGLMLGEETYLATRKNPHLTSLDWHDKALSLGQAAGIVAVQNPEQGEYGTILNLDSIDILRRTVERLELPPLPPQIGAMFGVRFGNGVVPANYLLHLYTAHRVSTILSKKTDTCLEIGGGVGLLAYVVSSIGFRQYYIVDLPLVNTLQAYLLLKSDLAKRVRLFGEDEINTESSIYIFPSSHVNVLPAKFFDLIISQDSLPEMNKETMIGYLQSIQKKGKGYFLSINQEAQVSSGPNSTQGWVYDICRNEPDLRMVYRTLYWMRKGYVEELYKVTNI